MFYVKQETQALQHLGLALQEGRRQIPRDIEVGAVKLVKAL